MNPTPCIIIIAPGSDTITYRFIISDNIIVVSLKQYKQEFNYYINPGDLVRFSHYKPVGLNLEQTESDSGN